MRETPEEVQWLQSLIDATHARANAHMAAIVKPERQLSAAQVVAYLQGLKHVAFGTVNAQCEPRVAPLDGHFVHGRFTLSTGRGSARWRDLERNPACSAAHYVGDDMAVVVNGQVDELTPPRPRRGARRLVLALRLEPLQLGRRRHLPRRARVDVGVRDESSGLPRVEASTDEPVAFVRAKLATCPRRGSKTAAPD
jgi:hypothetical protein